MCKYEALLSTQQSTEDDDTAGMLSLEMSDHSSSGFSEGSDSVLQSPPVKNKIPLLTDQQYIPEYRKIFQSIFSLLKSVNYDSESTSVPNSSNSSCVEDDYAIEKATSGSCDYDAMKGLCCHRDLVGSTKTLATWEAEDKFSDKLEDSIINYKSLRRSCNVKNCGCGGTKVGKVKRLSCPPGSPQPLVYSSRHSLCAEFPPVVSHSPLKEIEKLKNLEKTYAEALESGLQAAQRKFNCKTF